MSERRVCLLAVALLACWAGAAPAQDEEKGTALDDVPPPTAPFFHRPSPPLHVRIDIERPKPDGKHDGATPGARPQDAPVAQIDIVQQGKISVETQVLESGVKRQRWFLGRTELRMPERGRNVVMQRASMKSPLDDLAWLSGENYQKAVMHKGAVLYLFSETKSWSEVYEGTELTAEDFGGAAPPPPVTRTALIDAATKKPVLLKVADTIYRYTILPPPAGRLQLPAPLAEASRRLEGR